jgi:resuscitation-promoting factor RpfB
VLGLWIGAAVTLFVISALAVFLLYHYGTPVTVTVDGYTEQVRCARPDVAGLLAELGLNLRGADRVEPALSTRLTPGLHVTVRRARQGLIAADGTVHEVYSHADRVGTLLADAWLSVAPEDEIWLDGRVRASLDTLLPVTTPVDGPPRYVRGRAWDGHEPQPVRLTVRRAMAIKVDDGSVPYTINTTASTVGEALLREQVTLYLGDRVQPSLGSRIHDGMRVVIQRSRAILITTDGRTLQTRTRGRTIADALTELGIPVTGSDRVMPSLAEPVRENLGVQIVRVQQVLSVERKQIPFSSISVPDDNLDIDSQQMTVQGRPGEFRRRSLSIIEDGKVTSQQLLDAWVAAEPITQVLAYGRKITPRSLDTPEGTVTYWRKIRMYATSYSAATAGVSRASSYYGMTRLGLPMRRGLVAVDPTVIPLGTRIYVSGYGIGLAADTGGGVRARLIDLGYDDDNLQIWSRWVEVYILDTPPSPARIRWVLPNWPTW